MRSTVRLRLQHSIQSICISWLISGIVFCGIFCFLARGLGPISLWLIWGTGIFLLGWVAVGLPVIALGDRICRISFSLVIVAIGFCGAFIIACPAALTCSQNPQAPACIVELRALSPWIAAGFLVAAATGAIYRHLLCRSLSATKKTGS